MPRPIDPRQARFQEVHDKVYSAGFARLSRLGIRDEMSMKLLKEKAHDAGFAAMLAYVPPHPETPAASVPIKNAPVFKILPKPPVHGIFKDVVGGENTTVLRLLEHNVNTMRERAETIPILLVGPPSVGKTTTAHIIARAVERPFLPLSAGTMGSDLFKVIEGPLTQLHGGKPYTEVYQHHDSKMPVHRIAPTTVFMDEAHVLSSSVQTSLLMAMEKPYMLPRAAGGYLDFQDVLFLAGTTDPSPKAGGGGIVKPLRTRFAEVSFVHYGLESVAEIVRKHYKYISKENAILLARASKLYPRVALSLAKQAGHMSIPLFLHDFIGVDEQGLDPTDMKLLAVLEQSVRHKDPQKVAEARITLEQHAQDHKVSPLQLARAKALLTTDAPKPIGMVALADKLMITDQEDIRVRVHYLETLGLVLRTPAGVIRQF